MLYKFLVNAKHGDVYYLEGDEIELSDASSLEGIVEPVEKSAEEPEEETETEESEEEESEEEEAEETEETEDEEPEDEEE